VIFEQQQQQQKRASSRKGTSRKTKRSSASHITRSNTSLFSYEKKLFRMQKEDIVWIVVGCICEMLHGLVFPSVALVFSEIFKIFSLTDLNAQFTLSLKYMYIIISIALINVVATVMFSYSFALCGARLTKRIRLSMFSSMLRQEVAYHDMGDNKSSLLASSLSTMAPLCKGQK
jgi:ATP-binding cassette subfamily B (MDR/TAP) protein 1